MSLSVDAAPTAPPLRLAFDRLGVLIALVVAAGLATPFAIFRANRIIPGTGRSIFEALPDWEGSSLAALLVAVLILSLLRTPTAWRLVASLAGLALLAIAIGHAATFLTPPGDRLPRVSPGTGFWLLTLGLAVLATDSIARLRLGPWRRIGILVAVALGTALLLGSGSWNDLSVLREYANHADAFWHEAATHVELALGSLLAATLAGIPIGVLCHRLPRVRATVLNVLNAIQTIPSIALFGLLIAPLAWLSATVPVLGALGISGIGAAPAMVALFAYSLLPVVANTVVGLAGVPPAADDAARGMGMTDWQRLVGVQFPLAFPVILTGIRIVLVQNIGLATIAALIGGGGFGVFVFQGIGQTAMDLVLLGAAPTVALAFAAAVILDAAVEMVSGKGAAHD